MIDHTRAQELAAAALDFELTPEESAELERHLSACAACSDFAAALRMDAEALRDLPRFDAPEHVARAVKRGGRRAAPSWSLLAAMVGVLVVAVGVLYGPGLLRFGGSSGAAGPPSAEGGAAAPTQPPEASLAPEASAEPGGTPGPEASAAPTPGVETAWVAAPDQAAFDAKAAAPERKSSNGGGGDSVGPGSPAAAMTAAVETPEGVLAVGHACAGDRQVRCRAVVWRSEDGLTWERVAHHPSLAAGSHQFPLTPSGMVDVSDAGPGFVAGGWTMVAGVPKATIWWSTDGSDWHRVRLPGPDGSEVHAIAGGHGGLVAVGGVGNGRNARAAVWRSEDGIAWQAVPDAPDLAACRGNDNGRRTGMSDVIADAQGFVAVGLGSIEPGGRCVATAWLGGADAGSWSRVDVGGGLVMRSITRLESQFVAVGEDRRRQGMVWTSVDGRSWSAQVLETDGLNATAAFDAGVIAGGAGLVGSPDGETWLPVDDPALQDVDNVAGLATFGPGVIAVGSVVDVGDQAEEPRAWVLLPDAG